MIDKKFIHKILRSTLRRSRGLSDHHLMHPAREWFTGLAVASVLLIIGIISCVYLYIEYSSIEPETGAEIDAPAKIYQDELVNAALSELSARAARLEAQKQLLEARRAITTPIPQPETPEETVSNDPEPTDTEAVPLPPDSNLPETL